ncbi:hypothetical protein GIB67_018250 [Kingdonia uniflora]|uniref:Uncharacterized protein n=1 Tax=Kingdonia uniflora TaxID=39325 RepID=A0A7J7LD06_9MAGN|nr:hypothetical protein GIB67_018250 [Kingdonia uniflora]
MNIPIIGGYSEGEGATRNEDVCPSDKSLLRSFKIHRARSIALGQDKLPIRVHHHQSTWDLTEKTTSDGDATVIGGTWGFPALLEVFYNNLLAAGFKCIHVFGSWGCWEFVITEETKRLVGIPKEMDSNECEHYTCQKEDVSVMDRYDGTALLKFREALNNNKLEDWKEFILKKADRGRRVREGPLVCIEGYLEWFASVSYTMICPITVDLAADDDVEIHRRKEASVNEHGDTPVHQSKDIAEQYDASLQKLKEDKEKESEANINLREALKEKTSECDLLTETIKQMKEDIQLKRVLNEQCVLEFADLPRQLDAKILECKNLEEKNTSLEAELRQKSGLDDCNQSLFIELNKKCKENESLKVVNILLMEQIDLHLPLATPLVVLQSHQHVPSITQAKKYDDLLYVHEDLKKLIAKEDFRKKLVNAKEKMMSLEVNNNEWEVWRQTMKKTLASGGMGNIEDPTIEELFEQNKRFFTIA